MKAKEIIRAFNLSELNGTPLKGKALKLQIFLNKNFQNLNVQVNMMSGVYSYGKDLNKWSKIAFMFYPKMKGISVNYNIIAILESRFDFDDIEIKELMKWYVSINYKEVVTVAYMVCHKNCYPRVFV